MRDPVTTTEAERVEDAVVLACALLAGLARIPAPRGATRDLFSFDDLAPEPFNKAKLDTASPQDRFYIAVELAARVLPDDSIGRKVIAALRTGRPPLRKRGGRAESHGKRKPRDRDRDGRIATAVGGMVWLGFHPTRNPGTDRESGCSIVAEALRRLGIKKLGEKAVAAIWDEHSSSVRSIMWQVSRNLKRPA
jgi:hypothetical protein